MVPRPLSCGRGALARVPDDSRAHVEPPPGRASRRAIRECPVSGAASSGRDARVIRSAIGDWYAFFFIFRLTRETLPDDRHRTPLIVTGPRSRPSSSPSSSSSSRATTLNPHGPAAGADEALPLGVAARNDPAGDTSARRACAMTLLRSPRIKREPVTRRPLLFSSLCYPSISLRLSRRAAPRPPGGWPLRDRGCTEARAHTQRTHIHTLPTFVEGSVLLSTP